MVNKRIKDFPEGSGSLSDDDIFIFMDDPSGSSITKKISLSQISDNIVSKIVDFAPSTLDTLNELAAAINDDPNFFNNVAYSGDNISKFVNDVGYSISGHAHVSSDITDFNTAVSGLVSGVYAPLSGATFTGSIGGPSGDFTILRQNGTVVSVSGHTHPATYISDSTSFGRNILTASSYAEQNKLSWQIVSNNITAAAGGQYIIPTNAAVPSTITITDPSSPSNGDWYVVIKPSGAGGAIGGTVIGGVSYASASGIYLYRVYSADSIFSSSWKTYTLDKLHNHIASDITDFNSSVSGIVSTVPVVSLGTLTGSNAVNGGINNAIQTLTLNGTAVTFTKGTGWSSTADTSTDTVLKITASSPTSITWTIVNQWFNQSSGPLATGVHLFVLRSVGTSTIEGHYIGSQT